MAVNTPCSGGYVTGTGVVCVSEKSVDFAEGSVVVSGIVVAVMAGGFFIVPVSAPDTAVCEVGGVF